VLARRYAARPEAAAVPHQPAAARGAARVPAVS
jgi:hypothetical protein